MTTTQTLAALLTPAGTLRGPTAVPALRALLATEVRRELELAARQLEEGVIDLDPGLVALAGAALQVRVAVAVRWSLAGSSELERRLAADVDRALAPYREALLLDDDTEATSEWLVDLADSGVSIPGDSWWGFLAGPGWRAAGEVISAVRVLLRARANPHPPRREELSWDEHALAQPPRDGVTYERYCGEVRENFSVNDMHLVGDAFLTDHQDATADWVARERGW